MTQRAERVLALGRDAGAGNALASFSRRAPAFGLDVCSACAGPALAAFAAIGVRPDHEVRDITREGLRRLFDEARPDALLLGTSLDWQAERFAVLESRARGVRSVGLVDWWSNFGARFSACGSTDLEYLTDVVAVLDEDCAAGCLADGIPASILAVVGNPYWDDLREMGPSERERRRIAGRLAIGLPDESLVVLVVSSNIRNLGLGLGYDERDFWRALVPLPEYAAGCRPVTWVVKPHPQEPLGELEDTLQEFDVKAIVLRDLQGSAAVLLSDVVVGMCSSLVFESALLGRPAVSVQPGMDPVRLGHLRIFDRLGLPKVTDACRAAGVLGSLIAGADGHADLARLPPSLVDGRAAERLAEALRN